MILLGPVSPVLSLSICLMIPAVFYLHDLAQGEHHGWQDRAVIYFIAM